jgi:glutamate transport system substrate-binding protein
MKFRHVAAAIAVALALAAAGCGSSGGGPTSAASPAPSGPLDACQSSGVTFTPATTVALTGSPTYDKIKKAGAITIGVKADQPNLGYKDTAGNRCGFDIEFARLIASKLGIEPSKIVYSEIPSANRETALKGGEVDAYVGTYSITDKRKADVAFAGPYFIAGQSLLVRKDEKRITGKDTLAGFKVCSVTGSTAIQRARDLKLTDPANISEFKTYSECVSQLLDGRTDAVTTDDAILKGYAAQTPGLLKVVGEPFSVEKYGIGLPHDDAALRAFVNDVLATAESDGTWKKIYDGTLGRSGSPGTPPSLERY